MGRTRIALGVLAAATTVVCVAAATASTPPTLGSSGAVIPQSTQLDKAYSNSGAAMPNVFATTQRTSCYTPEVPFDVNLGPALGYSGESGCNNASNTGEDLGPYPTQAGSNPGYPASTPMLVKDHSESDIRVDPTDPMHVIGTSKWFVSPEGYNHLMGFYESFDGGQTFNVQGHVPGFEGWTDNTDPVGAFDTYGNFWFFDLAYQFFYNKDGSHNFTVGKSQEPNPVEPAEILGVAERVHGAKKATDWITTAGGKPDIVAGYDSVGNEPDKQWIAVDTTSGRAHSHTNRIYLMWVDFHTVTPVPFVSYADALQGGGHTPWSAPQALPTPPKTATGATYLLPHVAPDGTVYTTVTGFDPQTGFESGTTSIDKSSDGGKTWTILPRPVTLPNLPPLQYANTTFRDGISDTFAIGSSLDDRGHYPLYVAYEDYSAGVDNVLLTASYDDGNTWTTPIQINDNTSRVDEFQPNLSVSPTSGTVSVAWYDRRLPCPSTGKEATYAGVGLDPGAAGEQNYCINASVQFYDAALNPLGHNIRLTQHTWDPQLNSPHTGCPTCSETFIGDYFGNDWSVGGTDYFTFVSTYDDGTNPANRQQQVVASITP